MGDANKSHKFLMHRPFEQNTESKKKKKKIQDKCATIIIVAIGTSILAKGDVYTKPRMPIVQ